MFDCTTQLVNTELAASGLQQVSSVKSLDGSTIPGRFLVPGQLCGLTLAPDLNAQSFISAYYISDLHLETWYKEYCETTETPVSMSEWMETVMDSLFSGDFLQAIGNKRVFYHSFIVLFLGDIADTFAGSELFYTAFMRRWDSIDKKNRQLFEVQEAERLAERRVARHEADMRAVEEYRASHPWTERAKRPLVQYKKVPDEIKAAIQRVEQWERGETLDAGPAFEFHPASRNVFAVLGNHEISEFAEWTHCVNDMDVSSIIEQMERQHKSPYEFMNTDCLDVAYEQGKQKYKDLFQSLGIRFLDAGVIWEYGQGLNIAGFCGFNDPQIAPDVIGNYEIKRRDGLALSYGKCVELAKSNGRTLVFCTHFPLLHGTVDSVYKNNVYHFCGHTHRNELEILSETGAVIADNQIGYGWTKSHKKIAFEHISLYLRYNPFDAYEDGVHEIKAEDYQYFYWYCGERVKIGTVERYLRGVGPFNRSFGDTGRLYVIKRRDYYGFFIVFNKIKRVYICNGGKPKLLPDVGTIEEVLAVFDAMVDAYLLVFSGFRRYQEQIASYIRGFGGDGTIHGLIVDIDFFNHVGIDPVSGTVTFYYSPWFGAVQSYSDMGALLENHAPQLYPAYKQLSTTSLVPCYSQDAVVESELVSVERGGRSFYGASRYMSPVQRLFSCNILRVWDKNVLNEAVSAANSLEVQGIEAEFSFEV